VAVTGGYVNSEPFDAGTGVESLSLACATHQAGGKNELTNLRLKELLFLREPTQEYPSRAR
jgi:hypothetical protein